MSEIMEAPQPPSDIPGLIDHILEVYHEPLRVQISDLNAVAVSAPSVLSEAWAEFKLLIETHLMKEEHILFPTARALATDPTSPNMCLSGPLDQMAIEHEQIHVISATLRDAIDLHQEYAPKLLEMLDQLDRHATLEDEQLFPVLAGLAGKAEEAQALAEAEARIVAAKLIESMRPEPKTKRGRRSRLRRGLKRLLKK